MLPPYGPLQWVMLVAALIGLICLATLSRHLRPEVRGPVRAGELLFRPGLLTPRGRLLLAAGWVCVLFFNAMWWGGMLFTK